MIDMHVVWLRQNLSIAWNITKKFDILKWIGKIVTFTWIYIIAKNWKKKKLFVIYLYAVRSSVDTYIAFDMPMNGYQSSTILSDKQMFVDQKCTLNCPSTVIHSFIVLQFKRSIIYHSDLFFLFFPYSISFFSPLDSICLNHFQFFEIRFENSSDRHLKSHDQSEPVPIGFEFISVFCIRDLQLTYTLLMYWNLVLCVACWHYYRIKDISDMTSGKKQNWPQ